MKSVRNILFLSLFFMLMVLGGCASKEETDKGKNYEALAEPIIKQYVEDKYNGYEVKNISDVYRSEGLFTSYATEFVKATIENKNENKFNIIYDTKNDKLYSNYEQEKKIEIIRNKLNIPEILDIKIGYLHKDTKDIGVNSLNYYEIDCTDKTKYELCIYIRLKDTNTLDKIYNRLDSLVGIDYKIKIIIGDETKDINEPTYLISGLNIDKDASRSNCTLLNVTNHKGNIQEDIRKIGRLEFEDFFIIYDKLKYAVKVVDSDTKLGESESDEATSDYKLQIYSLDSTNKNCSVTVFSKRYSNIVYLFHDTLETYRENMGVFDILTLSHTFNTDIDIEDSLGKHEIVFALYNKKEDK